jgi:hypothetical protein
MTDYRPSSTTVSPTQAMSSAKGGPRLNARLMVKAGLSASAPAVPARWLSSMHLHAGALHHERLYQLSHLRRMGDGT